MQTMRTTKLRGFSKGCNFQMFHSVISVVCVCCLVIVQYSGEGRRTLARCVPS